MQKGLNGKDNRTHRNDIHVHKPDDEGREEEGKTDRQKDKQRT